MVPRFKCALRVFFLSFFFIQFSAQGKQATVTSDGAFALYGNGSSQSGHFVRSLSEYEKQFYLITGYAPSAFTPIIVVLHGAESDVENHPALRMDVLEDGEPKIQIDLSEQNLATTETSRVLAQALLLREYYAGKSPPPGASIERFPDWLLHGLGTLSNPESKPVLIPAAFLHGATPPSIEDLLVQKAPDDGNQSLIDLYDAMSATLLSAGFNGEDGAKIFRNWIGSFDPKVPQHSPSIWPRDWSMKSVERRWLLQMAGKSGEDTGVVALLSVGQTLDRYDEILSGITTPGHSIALLKKAKGSNYLVQQLAESLLALRLQANPIAVPLLDETMALCSRIKHLSEKKIAEHEKNLFEKRQEVLKRSESIDAYLDWFEAVKLPVSSGLFDHVLQIPDSPVRKGPVGRALDTIEARGW